MRAWAYTKPPSRSGEPREKSLTCGSPRYHKWRYPTAGNNMPGATEDDRKQPLLRSDSAGGRTTWRPLEHRCEVVARFGGGKRDSPHPRRGAPTRLSSKPSLSLRPAWAGVRNPKSGKAERTQIMNNDNTTKTSPEEIARQMNNTQKPIQDREAVRMLAIELGAREAARAWA